MKAVEFSGAQLKADILKEARALRRPPGAAEQVAERTVKYVEKWLEGRKVVTQDDLDRVTAKKLRELDKDLAYIYRNRDKIV